MGSSSFSLSSNGESISNILSSGVDGSSGSSIPLPQSISLLSTSIVSMVVSESGPGLAGSAQELLFRMANIRNKQLSVWTLMQNLPPLKSTSPKQSLGTFEAQRLWQLNLQSRKQNVQMTRIHVIVMVTCYSTSSVTESSLVSLPLHCMPWRKRPLSRRLQYWQIVGRV